MLLVVRRVENLITENSSWALFAFRLLAFGRKLIEPTQITLLLGVLLILPAF